MIYKQGFQIIYFFFTFWIVSTFFAAVVSTTCALTAKAKKVNTPKNNRYLYITILALPVKHLQDAAKIIFR